MKWYNTNFIRYKIALEAIVFGSAQTRQYLTRGYVRLWYSNFTGQELLGRILIWKQYDGFHIGFTYTVGRISLPRVFTYWGCQLKISTALNPKKKRHKCNFLMDGEVCVNSTSIALRLFPPADYQVPGAVFSAHLGAAITKIKDATLMSPGTWGRPLALLHPTAPKRKVQPVAKAHLVCSPCHFQWPQGPPPWLKRAKGPSPAPDPSPLANPTKMVKPANPSSSLFPCRAHRLVDWG